MVILKPIGAIMRTWQAGEKGVAPVTARKTLICISSNEETPSQAGRTCAAHNYSFRSLPASVVATKMSYPQEMQ